MTRHGHTNAASIAVIGSSLLVAGMGLGLGNGALAAETPTDAGATQVQPTVQQATVETAHAITSKEATVVNGTFAYTQSEVTPNDKIARSFANASAYLCAGKGAETTDVAAEDWTIEVTGDVQNPYAETVAELQDDPDVQSVLLGCSCLGNPADGQASINAQVTGVSVLTLLTKAGVTDGANTVVFTSSDGYEVALPLNYLVSHYCPIVFDVNGSPIAETIGGTNQLWLGSTSAKYFARDITSIRVETRDVVPDAPDSEAAQGSYANLPNIGVDFGGEVA